MTEYITRNHHCEEFEVIIKTNSFEQYKAAEEFARRLIDHAKPMSNADRIRAMNNEELAKIIASNVLTGACNDFTNITGLKSCPHDCKKCVLAWLNKPMEEELWKS